MSREYLVLIMPEPEDGDIEDAEARVYMRFTEEPSEDYLHRLAWQYPGQRVYSLLGASTWHQVEK